MPLYNLLTKARGTYPEILRYWYYIYIRELQYDNLLSADNGFFRFQSVLLAG